MLKMASWNNNLLPKKKKKKKKKKKIAYILLFIFIEENRFQSDNQIMDLTHSLICCTPEFATMDSVILSVLTKKIVYH
jgi:hypothetical protein